MSTPIESTYRKRTTEEAREALDSSWIEAGDVVARFAACRELEDDAKAAWRAVMVAGSLEAKPEYSATTNPLHARLAPILEIDVAQHPGAPRAGGVRLLAAFHPDDGLAHHEGG